MSQIALSESKRGAERRGLALVGWPLIALVAAGLALRLFLSRAPLWNDEIWSILNLRSLDSPAGVLWGLSHDNNHFLNSLWLWGVTPFTADPTALRLVSILAGAATIPVMARLGARHGAGFVAAALTALSFFQIVYSVEARGYAVATLALVLTWSEIEAERPSRLRLALFSGLGFFAHLAFGPALAGLAFAAFLENIRKARGAASTAFAETFWLFWPSALACLPTLAFFVAGYVNKGGFTIGAFTPFSYGHAIGGVASLGMMTFGLDPTSFLQTDIRAARTADAHPGGDRVSRAARSQGGLCGHARAAARAGAGAQNSEHPCRALFLRGLAVSHPARGGFFTEFGRRGVAARALALFALAAALAGDAAALTRLAHGEAAPWTDALAVIRASDAHSVASNHDFNVGKSIAWDNAVRGGALDLIPPERVCEAPPAWYILETRGDGAAEPSLSVGAPACALPYRLEAVYNRDIPSQLPWALYRRAAP